MRTIADLSAAMQAIVDLADAETRSLTPEEITQYETLEGELHSAQKSEDIRKRQAAWKSPVIDGTPAVIKPTPKGDDGLEFAFEQYLRTGHPNADMAELFAQSVGTDSAGGYLVPSGFLAKLTERRLAYGGLAPYMTQFSTGNGVPYEWPSNDDTASNRADITAEGAASAAGADIAFGTVTIGAYKYSATGTGNVPIKVSVELLQDASFDVGSFVARILGNRIARKMAVDVMQASGTGAPQGVLYGGSGGDVKLAAGGAITYAKLKDLEHAVDPEYRGNARWVFNDNTAKDIENLTDGQSRPLITPSVTGLQSTITAGVSLLGYPVVIDQGAFNKANIVRFAAFGDWEAAYVYRTVADVQVLVNPYSSANTGQVEYNAWARMDCRRQDVNAFKTMEGTT